MNQNGQTHFKNLAAIAARFLQFAWPFWDIMHQSKKSGTSITRFLDRLKVDIYIEIGVHFDQLLWYVENMFLIIFQTSDLKKGLGN